jgi:chaperonin GroEL (HSP60 family)
VRSSFEALESIARLITNTKATLSRNMIKEGVKPRLLARAIDKTEEKAVSEVVDGLAEIVNSIHNYRHGAVSEKPVASSLSYAVFILSSVASLLRWLAEIDSDARE